MPASLIDSHCHLTFEVLARQLDAALERAHNAGVQRMVTVGIDPADARASIELARRHAGIHVAAGVHPHEAGKASDDDLAAIDTLLADPLVVAAGEMGLDYHYDFADRDRQKQVFTAQLGPARKHDLPVVIHCREAVDDAIAILEAADMAGRAVVFHCFTGTADDAAALLERGWWLSFTGIVTFRNSHELQAIARTYPQDRLMVETDAPYLSPVPVRKVRTNEPAHVVHTAKFLADLRGESFDDLAAAATANTEAFFRLP